MINKIFLQKECSLDSCMSWVVPEQNSKFLLKVKPNSIPIRQKNLNPPKISPEPYTFQLEPQILKHEAVPKKN